MESNGKITVGFSFTDEFGNKYNAESMAEIFHDLGETEVDFIGKQMNVFLRQCGYIRKNDNIFMEDITDEEYEALADYLYQLRNSEVEPA